MRTLLAAALCLGAASASAQETQERRGFWFSVGADFGSRGLSCETCIGIQQREDGLSTSIRLGGTVSRQVTLGAQISGWITEDNRSSGRRYALFSALMGVVQFYPLPRHGLFLQGGAGYIVDIVDDDLVIDEVGITVGAGYDIRVGRMLSLTPHLNYLGTIDGPITSSLYQVGLAVTWH